MDEQRKTVFDLEGIITRCISESTNAGDIERVADNRNPERPGWRRVIINEDAVVRHISMTIIGELYELEIVRKIAPMFRQFRSLERDFFYIEDRESTFNKLLALKFVPPPTDSPKTEE